MTSVQGTGPKFWRSRHRTVTAGEHAGSTSFSGWNSRGKNLCRQRFLNRKTYHWMLKGNRSSGLPSTFYTPQHKREQEMSTFGTSMKMLWTWAYALWHGTYRQLFKEGFFWVMGSQMCFWIVTSGLRWAAISYSDNCPAAKSDLDIPQMCFRALISSHGKAETGLCT